MHVAFEELAWENTVVTTNPEQPVTVQVTEEHHVAQARRAAMAVAEAIGFTRRTTYLVAIAVSELANNLLFHTTGGGRITLVALKQDDKIGLEVISEDEGPGIPDVQGALQDGFSTSGGLGSGLPGVRRLMDEFEITSTVGVGTRVVTRKWQSCKWRSRNVPSKTARTAGTNVSIGKADERRPSAWSTVWATAKARRPQRKRPWIGSLDISRNRCRTSFAVAT